MQIFSITDENN